MPTSAVIACRAVFLFHIGPDLHALGADGATVAKQLGGVGLDNALVDYVGEGEALGAHEVEAGGMGDGDGLGVGRGENLNTAGRVGAAAFTAWAMTVIAATIAGPTCPRR